MNNDIKEMEITDYNILRNFVAALYRMWKMKWIIVFTTIIGALLGFAFLTYQGKKSTYYSVASIYSAVYGSYSETATGVTIMNQYSGVLGTSRVCERAATEIEDVKVTASYLKGLVESGKVVISGASSESKSYGFRLVVQTIMDSPENVVEITNAMSEAYVAEINDLLGTDVLQVFEKAEKVNVAEGSTNYLLLIIFIAGGFALSAGIIFFKEFFSSKVYLVSQCERDKNMILGLLPYSK